MGEGSVRALILAGGSGTRLWPRSTDACPKPFLALAGESSLLVQTYRRAALLAGPENVAVSGRRAHAALIRRELPDLPERRLLLEPVRRNTAPAIALAALSIEAEGAAEAVLAVLPSDQGVRDEQAYLAALRTAADVARESGAFVTLGIPPTRPETGFGYLETDPGERGASRRVKTFVEKPNRADAERYLAAGTFFWNAGIFLFRVSTLLSAMEALCPDILAVQREALRALEAGDLASFDELFARSRSISIDYAVMERAGNVLTVPSDCGWSDLGSWEAVFELRGGGTACNVLEGPAVSTGGRGNLVLAAGRTVRVIGLDGVAVVDSPEGVLVMKLGASDDLRASVEQSLAPSAAEARS